MQSHNPADQASESRCAVSTKRTFLPGQRFRIIKEMERQVRGFREVSRELAVARRILEQQEMKIQDSVMDRAIQTSFYKSVMATRYINTKNIYLDHRSNLKSLFIYVSKKPFLISNPSSYLPDIL